MADLEKRKPRGTDPLRGVRRQYIDFSMQHQRQYLEEMVRTGNPTVQAVCATALTNLDASCTALEAAVLGFEIDVTGQTEPDTLALVASDQINLQRLMDASTEITRATYAAMAYNVLYAHMEPRPAYEAAVRSVLQNLGSFDALVQTFNAQYRNSSPEVQATAAVGLGFIAYLHKELGIKLPGQDQHTFPGIVQNLLG